MQVGRMRYRIEIQDYNKGVDDSPYGMGRHRSRFR